MYNIYPTTSLSLDTKFSLKDTLQFKFTFQLQFKEAGVNVVTIKMLLGKI